MSTSNNVAFVLRHSFVIRLPRRSLGEGGSFTCQAAALAKAGASSFEAMSFAASPRFRSSDRSSALTIQRFNAPPGNSRPSPLERLGPRLPRHCRILRSRISCLGRTAISPLRGEHHAASQARLTQAGAADKGVKRNLSTSLGFSAANA